MKILFIHQNYPAQYREILPRLAASKQHNIIFLTQNSESGKRKGYSIIKYAPHHKPAPDAYTVSDWFEETCGNGVGVMQALRKLKTKGYTPDIVVGHAGWGEVSFVKDVWPQVPLLGYFEYYFLAQGGCVGFDPEYPAKLNTPIFMRSKNAINNLNLLAVDGGYTASTWQKNTHPAIFHDKISVFHEGIRTDRLQPDHDSDLKVTLGETSFARGEKIVTYIARNLEPIRGSHSFLRALPRLQKLAPDARVAIIGGDKVSYGRKPKKGEQNFRDKLVAELGERVDWGAVHFLGRIDYPDLIDLLKISNAHVYLTVPFVTSWSLLEAMALEKTVIASDVSSLRPIIDHGRNGLLVDFFAPDKMAEQIAQVLEHPDNMRDIGRAARADMVEHYDFNTVCYPQFIKFLNRFLPADKRVEV